MPRKDGWAPGCVSPGLGAWRLPGTPPAGDPGASAAGGRLPAGEHPHAGDGAGPARRLPLLRLPAGAHAPGHQALSRLASPHPDSVPSWPHSLRLYLRLHPRPAVWPQATSLTWARGPAPAPCGPWDEINIRSGLATPQHHTEAARSLRPAAGEKPVPWLAGGPWVGPLSLLWSPRLPPPARPSWMAADGPVPRLPASRPPPLWFASGVQNSVGTTGRAAAPRSLGQGCLATLVRPNLKLNLTSALHRPLGPLHRQCHVLRSTLPLPSV